MPEFDPFSQGIDGTDIIGEREIDRMRRPGICIPITDTTRDRIIQRAKEFAVLPAELVEWRVDFFAGYEKEIISVLRELREVLREKKLIVTLRTVQEGGEENGSRFGYTALLSDVAASGLADYVDVEIHRDPDAVQAVIRAAEQSGTKIIGSFHDFTQTPSEEENLHILEEARTCGADIGKVACMPSTEVECGRVDAVRLLAATEQMKEKYPDFPLITMCMGEAGKMTRLYGGLYGSEVSFGCVGRASAPGQIELSEMKEVFDKLYSGKRHIALIGFMGVGKSTVSRALHRLSRRPEIDTDQRIVKQQGCPISQIFEERGELYFRQLETDLIDGLATMEPGIISCGGGMALRDINVKKLRAIGEIVFLTAEPETIYERVKNSTDRPLLNGNMNVPYIRELMEKRRPFYEKAATVTVSTDGKSAEQIAREILSAVS